MSDPASKLPFEIQRKEQVSGTANKEYWKAKEASAVKDATQKDVGKFLRAVENQKKKPSQEAANVED